MGLCESLQLWCLCSFYFKSQLVSSRVYWFGWEIQQEEIVVWAFSHHLGWCVAGGRCSSLRQLLLYHFPAAQCAQHFGRTSRLVDSIVSFDNVVHSAPNGFQKCEKYLSWIYFYLYFWMLWIAFCSELMSSSQFNSSWFICFTYVIVLCQLLSCLFPLC